MIMKTSDGWRVKVISYADARGQRYLVYFGPNIMSEEHDIAGVAKFVDLAELVEETSE